MAVKENYDDGVLVKGTSKADSITNSGSNVTISAGKGDDDVWNRYGGDVTSISGGSGNDSIYNDGDFVTISGGDGDDSIYNDWFGKETSISGGKGNDYIHNYGYYVTVDAGTSNDTIENDYDRGDDVLIKYSGGNDLIRGFKEDSTLKIASGTMNSVITTNGSDYFVTVGKNIITLEGAAGLAEVNIVNSKGKAVKYKVEVDYNFTKGNDSVTNRLSNVSLNALGGNDSILNFGDKVTIDGGKGNDTIENHGDDVLIKYSGGNDSISLNKTSTLQIASGKMNSVIHSDGSDYFLTVGKNIVTLSSSTASLDELNIVNSKGKAVKYKLEVDYNFTEGNDSVTNYLSNVSLNALGGDDTIENRYPSSNVTINAGNGNDSVVNYSGGVTIIGGRGNDYIGNAGGSSTIDGGKGNDYIYIWSGPKISVNGGAGNDTIESMGFSTNITINGGKGNDSIINHFSEASINGGAGNDSIRNNVNNVTINAGTGNDSINLSDARNNLIQYTLGDGNDTIIGFNKSDTLSISGGSYSTQANGNDLLVKVGTETITLKNAYATADTIHINKKSLNLKRKTIQLSDSDDILISRDSLSVVGSAGDDYIDNEGGSKVIIKAGAGNDTIFNYYGEEFDEDGDEIDKEARDVKIYGGAGNDYIENSCDKVTISGGSGDDEIYNFGDKVTIDGGKGNDTIENEYGNKVSIYGGAGNDELSGGRGQSTLWGGIGNDSLFGGSGKDIFVYKPGEGTDIIRSYDYSGGDMLKILKSNGKSGGTFTEATFSGDELTLAINGGGTVIFDNVSAGDKIKINSKTYTIKNGTFK